MWMERINRWKPLNVIVENNAPTSEKEIRVNGTEIATKDISEYILSNTLI